ncbi:hypothetical protein Cadr_000020079 [Camelus dromedarius]|uniref:Uncharacterized protein n=1 Tax=Camelus dromedarius TaxID=9838 RepID=A0A5N4CZG9_CAMDR|nr:hypothetical protein Cadr_000020079 [Camelus dromedarius]
MPAHCWAEPGPGPLVGRAVSRGLCGSGSLLMGGAVLPPCVLFGLRLPYRLLGGASCPLHPQETLQNQQAGLAQVPLKSLPLPLDLVRSSFRVRLPREWNLRFPQSGEAPRAKPPWPSKPDVLGSPPPPNAGTWAGEPDVGLGAVTPVGGLCDLTNFQLVGGPPGGCGTRLYHEHAPPTVKKTQGPTVREGSSPLGGGGRLMKWWLLSCVSHLNSLSLRVLVCEMGMLMGPGPEVAVQMGCRLAQVSVCTRGERPSFRVLRRVYFVWLPARPVFWKTDRGVGSWLCCPLAEGAWLNLCVSGFSPVTAQRSLGTGVALGQTHCVPGAVPFLRPQLSGKVFLFEKFQGRM